jgi:hypothetical protein
MIEISFLPNDAVLATLKMFHWPTILLIDWSLANDRRAWRWSGISRNSVMCQRCLASSNRAEFNKACASGAAVNGLCSFSRSMAIRM